MTGTQQLLSIQRPLAVPAADSICGADNFVL
jgi:hypothetical protein